MNKSINQKIFDFINRIITDNPDTIFVLKGLPNFYNDKFEYLLNIKLDNFNKTNLASEIINQLNNVKNRKNYIIHYHELLFLSEIKLFGMFTNLKEKLDLKIKLINIDLFFERYPSFETNIDWELIFKEFSKHAPTDVLLCNVCAFGEINGKSEMRKLQKKLYRIRKMGS